VLKPALKEGEDFLLVDEFVWDWIKGKFGCCKLYTNPIIKNSEKEATGAHILKN
jgi:hypothetical protein